MAKFIFANWKENKNLPEALSEVKELGASLKRRKTADRVLVILTPVVFLHPLFEEISKSSYPIKLGVQDISVFEGGAYTGEIAASMVSGMAAYALVGHSERRRIFSETPILVNQKIELCLKNHLEPIICVSSFEELSLLKLPDETGEVFLAYEDPKVIGGEKVSALGEVKALAQATKERFGQRGVKFVYGGSVSERNASVLLQEDYIDGLLVGHHSLVAQSLLKIVG